jgi:23S rRNA pseudouridine1911/1915/1917 synthase
LTRSLLLAVPPEAAGERFDRYLATVEGIGSRAEAERLVREGRALLDGERRPKSYRLEGGEQLALELTERVPAVFAPEELELEVLYEDEDLLVVDKPAGLVVHPGAGHATGTLVHGLLERGIGGGTEPERPGIVHRLDRDTSGLLVVARNAEAHLRLQRALRRRTIVREYVALVHGRPLSWSGRIEAPIGRDRDDRTRMSLDTDRPRDAVTLFDVTELLDEHAVLRVRLETGRTHQIRVHLAAISLPVAGDPVYGRAGELGLDRQFLHAARLAFEHPVTAATIDIESPLPPDLLGALERAHRAGRG